MQYAHLCFEVQYHEIFYLARYWTLVRFRFFCCKLAEKRTTLIYVLTKQATAVVQVLFYTFNGSIQNFADE